MTIELWKKDRDGEGYNTKKPTPKWCLVKRKGLTYLIDGEQFELFTLRHLAEAVDRTTKTVMAWEAKGLIPRAMFVVPNRGKRRFYSGQQLKNIQNVMLTKYNGLKYIKERPILEQFLKDITDVWYHRNVVIDTPNMVEIQKKQIEEFNLRHKLYKERRKKEST